MTQRSLGYRDLATYNPPGRLTAMREAGVGIAFVDLAEGYLVFNNNVLVPITIFFDEDGEVVENWKDAVTIEFGTDEFGYGTHRIEWDSAVSDAN
jgi:hypothetical protein